MALAIDRYPLGPYQANCYVVRSDRTAPEAVVVDPGAEASGLRLELARLGTRCAGILVTHTDLDHIGAVAELAEGTGAEVWCPAAEAEVLRDPTRLPRSGGVPPYEPEHLVAGGDTITVAGIAFEVLDVPGHSSGHVAFLSGGDLFSGDLLFAGSVGRTDLTGGDWDALVESVRALFERLPPDTVVHSGHGPETTLGRERATNPFLAELRTPAQQ
jgi:glyoxylase-like metal-dependent hydrolase (beta-lactamase superfamily II)